MNPSFADRLIQAVKNKQNPVIVGLDPRWEHLPEPIRDSDSHPGDLSAVADAFGRFCRETIDVVAPLVPCVKPQAAFFEALGPPGMQALWDTIQYARRRGLLVVLDAKRGDIGSTASAYAEAYLGPQSPWGADALTINPYLGEDALRPFVDVARQQQAGLFVLVKTSNPGGKLLQDLTAQGMTVYRHVAALVEQLTSEEKNAGGYGSVGAVVGATYPEQLAELRAAMPHTWLLVPGFGAQGGAAADVAGAFDTRGLGAVVNSSRAIIFAHERPEYRDKFPAGQWQRAVEAATREMIEQLADETPAGRLKK